MLIDGINYNEEDFLYLNNLIRRSFQWELWQSCNNVCSFCYIGRDNRHTDKERQLESLRDLRKNLEVLDFDLYNNISLIGGEFFQGQMDDEEVNDAFFEIINIICDLYLEKKIGSIWIAATLTIGDQADLYKMLNVFDKKGVRPNPSYESSGLWICTSWDAEGRFLTKKRQETWEFHMKNIHEKYPWVKKNTTIILMQKLCEMYLDGNFVPDDFMKEFSTEIFYKQPGLLTQQKAGIMVDGMPEIIAREKEGRIDDYLTKLKGEIEREFGFRFYPDRNTFRKFLIKYAKNDPSTFEKLFNIKFRADELHRNFNEHGIKYDHCRDKHSNIENSASSEMVINPNCLIEPFEKKHVTGYATYSDCNKCMLCDRNQIWSGVKNGTI